MFNIKAIKAVFITLLIFLSLANSFLTDVHIVFFIALISLYFFSIILGSFHIRANFYMKSISSVKSAGKEIAITFDDGPDKSITPEILKFLKEKDIKAAFFCIGKKVKENKALAKQIVSDGHIIGNHTNNHSNFFGFKGSAKMIEELCEAEKNIYLATGKKVKYFRPPFGVTNPAISRAVRSMEYTSIGWNIRSLDTNLKKKEEKILKRVKKRLKPGSIILFHDINPSIIGILTELNSYIKEKNFKVVSLEELTGSKAYV